MWWDFHWKKIGRISRKCQNILRYWKISKDPRKFSSLRLNTPLISRSKSLMLILWLSVMRTVRSLNTWTGIRSNLIARHLIWYEKIGRIIVIFNNTFVCWIIRNFFYRFSCKSCWWWIRTNVSRRNTLCRMPIFKRSHCQLKSTN